MDALCPFGGVETLYKWAVDGTFLRRTFPSSLILLAGTVLLALVLRRAFCGWICPLGAMQEVFAGLGRRLGWRRSTSASRVDAKLRALKYVVLVVIVAATWAAGDMVFRPYDPWAAWAHLSAGLKTLGQEFLVGSLVLGLSLLGSLVIDRPWCRYLCPLGALLGGLARAGAVRVVRREETCLHCRACDRACPVDIPIEAMPQVRTTECLSCAECVAVCPAPRTLELRSGRRVWPPLAFGLVALALYVGVIVGSQAAGVWRARPLSMAEITGEGSTLDPANIRGFMTFEQIEQAYGVPVADLLRELSLPADTDPKTEIRNVLEPAGREVEEVRQAVARLRGASSPAGGALPPATPGPGPAAPSAGGPAVSSEEPRLSGMMTLRRVDGQYGVPAEWLVRRLGLPADTDREVPLRDLLRQRGREVQEVREAVEEYRRSHP